MTRLTKVVPRESKCMGLGACGAAVLRPYEEFGERLGLGRLSLNPAIWERSRLQDGERLICFG